jgi:hypothetical protein
VIGRELTLDEGELDAVLRRWRGVPDAKAVWPRDVSVRVRGSVAHAGGVAAG